MRSSGNSTSDDAHRRLELALRGTDADRVLERARQVDELTLEDALQVTTYLVRAGDTRADRASARLVARIVLEARVGMEDADAVMALVERLPDGGAIAELRRYFARPTTARGPDR